MLPTALRVLVQVFRPTPYRLYHVTTTWKRNFYVAARSFSQAGTATNRMLRIATSDEKVHAIEEVLLSDHQTNRQR